MSENKGAQVLAVDLRQAVAEIGGNSTIAIAELDKLTFIKNNPYDSQQQMPSKEEFAKLMEKEDEA